MTSHFLVVVFVYFPSLGYAGEGLSIVCTFGCSFLPWFGDFLLVFSVGLDLWIGIV